MKARIRNKHQAAPARPVNLKNRVGHIGVCRCGWFSTFVRATPESAARDTQAHIEARI